MIKEAIIKLANRQDLTYEEAEQVMNEIMERRGRQHVQMAAFLTALAMKGETIDEITACAAAMRAHCEKLLHNMDVLEIVGTGGDGSELLQYLHHLLLSSLLPAAFPLPSMATGQPPPNPEPQTCLEALGVKIDHFPGAERTSF